MITRARPKTTAKGVEPLELVRDAVQRLLQAA